MSAHFGNRERGATFIEFALILPVLVLIIFFLLEMGRYMALYSALNIGADQAASLAAKIEGLEAAPDSDEFQEAYNSVVNRAMEPGLAGFLSPSLNEGYAYLKDINLTVPVAEQGESRSQVMIDEPIVLTMNAELRPILPMFPTWPIRITAESFREQRRVASLPVPTDCNGAPQGSPNYNQAPCPCPPDQFWDWDTQRCLCKVPYGDETDCGCPNGQVAYNDGWSCMCDTSVACQSHAHIQSSTTCNPDCTLSCACVCDPGFVDDGSGNCVCPDGLTEVNGVCLCVNSCLNGMIPDPNDACQCVCPPGSIDLGNGHCGCANENEEFDEANGQCECMITETDCVGGQIFRGQQCRCTCPTNAVWNGTSCECEEPFAMGENGRCGACSGTIPCTGASQRNNACICVCDPYATMDGGGECACLAGRIFTGGACVCDDSTPCSDGRVRNSHDCQCYCQNSCPGGTVDQTTCGCICPEGRVEQNGACVCDQSAPCPDGRVRDAGSCVCACPGGTVEYGGQCVTGQCLEELQICGTPPTIQADGSCWCDE